MNDFIADEQSNDEDPDVGRKHQNDTGKVGFNYFQAYFMDFDDSHYKRKKHSRGRDPQIYVVKESVFRLYMEKWGVVLEE